MLNNANTGIIAVDENDFVLYKNNKALNMIGLSVFTNLKQLKKIDDSLYEAFHTVDENNNKKISFYNERGKITLSIVCTRIQLQGQNVKILVLNNIGSELEAIETETWTRLIRILTHEIMNSISPITSLSETLLNNYEENNDDDVKAGLEVINKTSNGLIKFVNSYRSLMLVSKPNKKAISYDDLIRDILTLVGEDLRNNNLMCTSSTAQDNIMLFIDKNQISQVIINIIKNAIQAKATKLNIHASISQNENIHILFSNNGTPIDKDSMEQIFIPFYTTKQIGSGIGLSLSRQIMNNHDGSIHLIRSNERETVFELVFR
jgi:two-component system nitrogen regulation sensor histidine kinase NtrY